MVYRLPPLNALRAFEATARNMSFAKAAEELFLTPSAISYQVKSLEDFLSVKLFTRLNRSIELTEAGAKLYPGLHQGFEAMQGAMDRLVAQTPDHMLVVSTGPAFSSKWLTPRIVHFMEAHPDIDIRIEASLKLTDFAQDHVDVSIRFGAGRYNDLYVEHLIGDWMTPMVSPALLARGPTLSAPDDLAHYALIHDDSMNFIANPPGWGDWARKAHATRLDTSRGPRFSHADHALNAAMRGTGVVLGRGVLAQEELANGQLIMPFPDLVMDTGFAFHFVCPTNLLERPKVEKFRAWMLKELDKDRARLSRLPSL